MEDKTTLLKKKKPELVDLCKARGLPITGTKEVLVCRILGLVPAEPVKKAPGAPRAKKVPQPPPLNPRLNPAINSARKHVSAIVAQKNKFGEFEYDGYIFDPASRRVVGHRAAGAEEVRKLEMKEVDMFKEMGIVVDENQVERSFNAETSQARALEVWRDLEEEDEDLEADDE